MATKVDILINSRADLKALQEAQQATDSLLASLKMGMSIDIGGRLVAGLAAIPTLLKDAAAEGVRLNAALETGRLSLASLLNQYGDGRLKTFEQRTRAADAALASLRQKGMLADATFEQLFDTLTQTSGAAFTASVGDFEKQIDVLVKASNVMAIAGGDQAQLATSLQQIYTGTINSHNRLARQLNITNEEVKKATADGQLYALLMDKMGPLSADAAAGQQTFSSQMTLMRENVAKLKQELSEPIFEALKESLAAFNAELGSTKFKESLRPLAVELAHVIEGGLKLADVAAKNSDKISLVVRILGALMAIRVAAWLMQVSVGLVANALNLSRETAELEKNTAAQAANKAARDPVTGRYVSAGTETARGGTGLSSLMGAANIGLAVGVAINQLMAQYAAKVESGVQAVSRLNSEFNKGNAIIQDRIKGIASEQERTQVVADLQREIADLRERAASVDEDYSGLRDSEIEQIKSQYEVAIRLRELYIKQARNISGAVPRRFAGGAAVVRAAGQTAEAQARHRRGAGGDD